MGRIGLIFFSLYCASAETLVEQQLQKVLEKLRMIPEAGWEVWDKSD